MTYPLKERTLGHILEDKTAKNPDKIFFHFEDEQFTYSQTDKFANKIANGYMSLGIKKGETVTTMLPNCSEGVFNWFALAKLGAVDSAINTAYKGDLLKHVIGISNTKVLFVYEGYLDRIIQVQDDLTSVEKIVVFNPSGERPSRDIKFPVTTYDELIDESDDFSSPEEIEYSDPLQIIYTSGTTGPSKGVVLSHNAMYYYAMDAVESIGFDGSHVYFSCLPLYHINIRFFTICPALFTESRFAMVERFSATKFWDWIRKYDATAFCLLGAMTTFMLKQPPSDNDRDNPARIFWGGPMTVEQGKEFQERFDVDVSLGYFGMTECNWLTSLHHSEVKALKAEDKWEQALGMGKENKARFEVKLVDDYDNEVPVGQTGEIVSRPSRPFSMMTEYINMPEKTAEAFRNLWFHTGDIARKDEEGFFYFVDRKKDYIRRRGENVSSYEVEASVNANDKIAESAAIGIQSPEGEEEILIVIVLKEGETLTKEELLAWCEERMAKFMIPKYMKIVDEIPKTGTGRAQKFKLRDSLDRDSLIKVF